MKVAITGHRPNKLGNDYNLSSPAISALKQALITELNELKPTQLISGMALGIDTLFALIAIELNIPFIAAIPCLNQEKMWPQKSKDLYHTIINNPLCTIVQVSDSEYNPTCMQRRNEYMVNESDTLIAVWNGTSGGTANCLKYAQTQNKPIIVINPNNFIK